MSTLTVAAPEQLYHIGDHIGFLTFIGLAVPVGVAALGVLRILRRRGRLLADRRSYLPHLVVLLVIPTVVMGLVTPFDR